ncbi:DUF4302 domain-containing protein [Pedobacter nyackensis]|uniref:Type IV secretion system putative lipoprotein virB7 n=1 Tax=Pedobacter nyackensis TaxID=475255 RepID=A0A1W2C2X8_9SPHI|nr:DUF4302 domain-containing protein [Pedobacter nyackensis]SMC79451.1 protein of unknown function [Pedobacter nyackensis]
MKKIFILFTAILALTGCKESEILVFDDKPEVRLNQSITEVRTGLLSAQNGWIATLPTNAGGGYGFYMSFDASENVKMYADLTSTSIITPKTSTYRLKTVLGTELIFDTFNYISMLADPVPTVYGGVSGSGYKSDLEFLHVRSTADSMIFKGKKYGQPFVLVKATAAQKAGYEAGEYKTAIDKIQNFFATTKHPYVEIVSGAATLKAGISLDMSATLSSGKRINFIGPLADGKVADAKGKFAYTFNGIDILGGTCVYQGITFVRMAWKDNTTLALYDAKQKEYVVKSSPEVLVPLKLLMSYNGTYNEITIGTRLPLGVTSGFNVAYNSSVTKFAALFIAGLPEPRTLNFVKFSLVNATIATVSIESDNGTKSYPATASYNYTLIDGVLTLSNPVYDANWTSRNALLIDIRNYFLSGPFRLDWVTSTDPTTSNLAGLYRVADPTSFFYGTL